MSKRKQTTAVFLQAERLSMRGDWQIWVQSRNEPTRSVLMSGGDFKTLVERVEGRYQESHKRPGKRYVIHLEDLQQSLKLHLDLAGLERLTHYLTKRWLTAYGVEFDAAPVYKTKSKATVALNKRAR